MGLLRHCVPHASRYPQGGRTALWILLTLCATGCMIALSVFHMHPAEPFRDWQHGSQEAFGVSPTAVLHFMVQAVFFVILILSVFQSMSLTGKAARSNFGIPCRKVQNVPRFPQEDHWIAAAQVK